MRPGRDVMGAMEPCVPSILANQPVEPERAPVAPRARRLPNGEVLPLEQIAMQFVRHGERGVIHLGGGPGSGKTTALRHLAAVLPRDTRVLLFDGEPSAHLRAPVGEHLAVVASDKPPRDDRLAHVVLAGWCEDDLIEYLLATHAPQCKAIMARVRADQEAASRLGGSPMLWRIALDEFAADEALRFVASAVRKRVFDLLESNRCATAALIWCLKRARRQQPIFELPDAVMPILAQPAVQALLGAEHLADLLSLGRVADELNDLPHGLVRETALLVRARPAARARLAEGVSGGGGGGGAPGAASILAAADPTWRPGVPGINLADALLERVSWRGVDLSSANLVQADFTCADLTRADLSATAARGAQFRAAKLRRARMRGINAPAARFVGANLQGASLVKADLSGATLTNANLTGASLRGANLTKANLSDARCIGTRFDKASLVGTSLKGADLAYAMFTAARLDRVWFDASKPLEHTRFRNARVTRCDLGHVRGTGLDFGEADLSYSDLTRSALREANFVRARLRKAKLAHVDWEGADLRRADLRGATFHLGSCRSGLVGSTVPCEGSRTGFYTDELDEQEFKSPEEIRKANLCGADLRGAKIKGVDFYLVDLRGARYTRRQARYLQKCGAIL